MQIHVSACYVRCKSESFRRSSNMMYETSPEPNWVLLLPILKVIWNQDPWFLGGPQGSQLKSAECHGHVSLYI